MQLGPKLYLSPTDKQHWYSCASNQSLMIRVECPSRTPSQFLDEVEIQKKAASKGFAPKVFSYWFGLYATDIDRINVQMFYIVVMEKASYSLDHVLCSYPFLNQSAVKKLSL